MADATYEAISKAKRQKESGNLDGAMRTLEDFLFTDPHNTAPRILLAQLALESDRRDYCLMQLDAVLDLEPENIEARKAIVSVLKLKRSDTKECDGHFAYLIERCPNDAELMNSYAIFCKLQLTDYAKAESFYKRAIEIRPDSPEYRINYSILLVSELKRYTDAKIQLEKAVELDPSNRRAKDALDRLLKSKFVNGVEKKGFLSKFKR